MSTISTPSRIGGVFESRTRTSRMARSGNEAEDEETQSSKITNSLKRRERERTGRLSRGGLWSREMKSRNNYRAQEHTAIVQDLYTPNEGV